MEAIIHILSDLRGAAIPRDFLTDYTMTGTCGDLLRKDDGWRKEKFLV